MTDPERCPDCGAELPRHRTDDDVTFTVRCPCRITPEIREARRRHVGEGPHNARCTEHGCFLTTKEIRARGLWIYNIDLSAKS